MSVTLWGYDEFKKSCFLTYYYIIRTGFSSRLHFTDVVAFQQLCGYSVAQILLVERRGGFPPEQSIRPFLAAYPEQDYRGVPSAAALLCGSPRGFQRQA